MKAFIKLNDPVLPKSCASGTLKITLALGFCKVKQQGPFLEILPNVWFTDERMLEVFDNDSIRRILRVRRRDGVPSVELRRRLCLTSIPALFVQRRLRWFGYAARRPQGELIKDLLLPTLPSTLRRRAGGQLKT